MAQNKTTQTEKSVAEFIDSISDDAKRNDCFELIKIIKKLTKIEPKM